MKTTFALQDQNNITDRLMEVGITLFSNIVNLPILFLAIYVYGRVSSFYQAKRTKFYFQPTNKLYQELLKNSKLTQMVSQFQSKMHHVTPFPMTLSLTLFL